MNASTHNPIAAPPDCTKDQGLGYGHQKRVLNPASTNDENNLWLPPRRMRQYQWMKVVGGLLIVMIFIGWLILQGSDPVIRTMTIGLIFVTLWVVVRSITDDQKRNRGRQIEISNHQLTVTLPHGTTTFSFSQVVDALWKDDWQDDACPGLTFYNGDGQSLVHLDNDFLADQAEARRFLHWIREHTNLPFKVRWPS